MRIFRWPKQYSDIRVQGALVPRSLANSGGLLCRNHLNFPISYQGRMDKTSRLCYLHHGL